MRISPISKISCNSIQKRPSQKISFGISIPLLTDIKTLNGVRPIFAKKVEDSIHAFPEKYKEILEANKYKTIISPTIFETLIEKGIHIPEFLIFETRNPLKTLSTTFRQENSPEKFMVFCDKQCYHDDLVRNLVNHELAKGVVKTLKLDEARDISTATYTDLFTGEKLNRYKFLHPEDRNIVQRYFTQDNGDYNVAEITADLIAWLNGGGKYGSGIFGSKDPELMFKLFPALTKYLQHHKY